MNTNKAKECYFKLGPIGGGLTFFPYQLAFGLSLRYWRSFPAIRIYVGPIKFWAHIDPWSRGEQNED